MQNSMPGLRIPPQNIEAEMALLGSIMLRPDALYDMSDTISVDSYYSGRHGVIYEAMLDLFGRRQPIDLLSVSSKLTERNQLDLIGGNSYLTELVNVVPSAANATYYAQIIQKKSLMRRLIEASEHISNIGYEDTDEIEEMLDRAEKKLFDVTNVSTHHKFTAIKDELDEAWERFDKLQSSGEGLRGVATGFADIDSKLAGFQKSDLIILAARPSMGKTSLALDIARQAAVNNGTPVGIFSLEMSSQQLVDRMIAAQANVDAWKLRTGKLSKQDDYGALGEAIAVLSKAPIYIDDQPANNIIKMRSIARRMKSEHGLGMIVVDYLQLMAPSSTKSDNIVQQVTEISRSLKQLARELEVPVLALSQLSRAVEQRGGRPRLSDLRDSGCLTGDTLIQRADTGERIPIKDLVGQSNIPIVSMDAVYNLRPMLASKVFSSGMKQIFALRTRSGRTIKASGNHKFLTFDGWQQLDTIQEGDRLALPRMLTATDAPSVLSVHELTLLAHLIGDGCVLPRQPIHYTSADEKNIEAVENAATQLFNISPRRIRQKNWWHAYLPSPYHLTHGIHHPITEWYTKLGIKPVRSYEKRIPQAVFSSDSKSIQLFLHHLWATDGNISWKKLAGRKPAAAIYYSSTSHGLAEDVQHLLLRLGIWSSVREVPQIKGTKTYRSSYHVLIQSTPVQLKFLELVGSFGSRGAIVKELIVALREIAPIPNTDTIPQEAWGLVATEKHAADMSWRDVSSALGTSYNGSALMTTGISRIRLAKVAKAIGSETLTHLAESDVYWDEVATIEPLGIEEVFDASVPGTHNFVAGDIIVHNSIEQDADVVMFIHREDKYKDESERTNIAEILIEKHRNGETGKVELFFNDKKATFQTIDKSNYKGAGADKEFADF